MLIGESVIQDLHVVVPKLDSTSESNTSRLQIQRHQVGPRGEFLARSVTVESDWIMCMQIGCNAINFRTTMQYPLI